MNLNESVNESVKYLPLLIFRRARISFPFIILFVLGAIFVYPNVHDEGDLLRLAIRAQQGNVRAQVSLGICFAMGHGVEQDMNEAVAWWKSALEQGLRNVIDWLKKNGEKRYASSHVPFRDMLSARVSPCYEGLNS